MNRIIFNIDDLELVKYENTTFGFIRTKNNHAPVWNSEEGIYTRTCNALKIDMLTIIPFHLKNTPS